MRSKRCFGCFAFYVQITCVLDTMVFRSKSWLGLGTGCHRTVPLSWWHLSEAPYAVPYFSITAAMGRVKRADKGKSKPVSFISSIWPCMSAQKVICSASSLPSQKIYLCDFNNIALACFCPCLISMASCLNKNPW